jgi:hypothetical protein
MVFPASAAPAPLFVSISPIHNVSQLTIVPNAALPAGATIKVGVLKVNGIPANIADYNVLSSLTAGGVVELSAGTHIAVFGLSTGTGGTVQVDVFGDRVGGR